MDKKDCFVIYELVAYGKRENLKEYAETWDLPVYELPYDNAVAVLEIRDAHSVHPSNIVPARVVGMIAPYGIFVIEGDAVSKVGILEYVTEWKKEREEKCQLS